jgi:hypothetical protein
VVVVEEGLFFVYDIANKAIGFVGYFADPGITVEIWKNFYVIGD